MENWVQPYSTTRNSPNMTAIAYTKVLRLRLTFCPYAILVAVVECSRVRATTLVVLWRA